MAIPIQFVYTNTRLEMQEKSPAWTKVCHNLLCAECNKRYTDFESFFPSWVTEDFEQNKSRAHGRRPWGVKYGFCSSECRKAADNALTRARKFVESNEDDLKVLVDFGRQKEASILRAKMDQCNKDIKYYDYYLTH